MLKNYLVLFVRNLKRQKLFSSINLLGLTVSIMSTLLIFLYVQHEFSFDRFHANVDRIYRVNQTFIWGENNTNQFASTGPGVAYAIKEELPEVELISCIHTPGNYVMIHTNEAGEVFSFEENRVLAADSNFFAMFSFPLLHGDVNTVFDKANTMVMTQSTARKYFGDRDPIGSIILVGDDQKPYEVTGVVNDTPDNSYIQFDVLLSMRGFPIERFSWSWVWTQLETYIRLDENASVAAVEAKLVKIPEFHTGQTLQAAFNTTWDEFIKSGKKWELFLQPMTSIHLPNKIVLNRLNDAGNIVVVYSFIGAAIFIVLLSCVNFMNLSTAQFTRRIKEAAVRKIMGLSKMQLSIHYFFEALSFCALALILALALTQLLLPGFNLITSKSLELNIIGNSALVLSLVGLIVLMALISASYPALFLTAFNPAEAIKGKLKVGQEGKSFRNTLVVFQFSVSIVLMICTAIVFQQLKFISDKDLGFNKENVIVVRRAEATNGEQLAHSMSQIPGVRNASWCSTVPPRIWGGDTFGFEGSDQRFPINFLRADEHYLSTLQIQLKAGRFFQRDNPADINRVVVNEATIRKVGWEANESVIGKVITYENERFEIIGVLADFNYWSLENPIEPMAIFHMKTEAIYDNKEKFIALRMDPQGNAGWEETLSQLQMSWKKHAGAAPFDFYFVDQAFAETFRSQQQFGKVLVIMASLAILIASLGLLGMIVYALEQRKKEIGIRKISGASVLDILRLIAKGYTRLIVIAFILAAPFAYWLMEKWLQTFAFKVTPSFWIFLLTGAGTLLMSLLITGYHSAKAALTNPVDVLKEE